MKKLALIACMLPGMSLAHGAHPPVAPEMHDSLHVMPWLGLVAVVLAAVLLYKEGRGS